MKSKQVVIGIECTESAIETHITNIDYLTLIGNVHGTDWQYNVDPKQFAFEINRVITSDIKEGGLGFDQITALVIAAPGMLRYEDEPMIVKRFEDLWKRRKRKPKMVRIMNPGILSLETLYPDLPAVFVSCGHYSYAVARNKKGEFISAGGWGTRIPDPGSLQAVGNAILNYISRVFDKRAVTSPFIKSVCESFSIDTPAKFYRAINDNSIDNNSLFEAACNAAEERDIVATSILDITAQDIVELIRHITADLPMNQRIPIILKGRLFGIGKLFTSMVQRKLTATLPHITMSSKNFTVSDIAVQYAIDYLRKKKIIR